MVPDDTLNLSHNRRPFGTRGSLTLDLSITPYGANPFATFFSLFYSTGYQRTATCQVLQPPPPPIACQQQKRHDQTAPDTACYGVTSWRLRSHINRITYAGQYITYFWGPLPDAMYSNKLIKHGGELPHTVPPPLQPPRFQGLSLWNYHIRNGCGFGVL